MLVISGTIIIELITEISIAKDSFWIRKTIYCLSSFSVVLLRTTNLTISTATGEFVDVSSTSHRLSSVNTVYEIENYDVNNEEITFIENNTSSRVRLIGKEWNITDEKGRSYRDTSLGFKGELPELNPGEYFEYTSYAPLEAQDAVFYGSCHI